jgi:hypothetical protein
MKEHEIEQMLADNFKMKEALKYIVDWKLPLLPDIEGRMVNYGILQGSNGERDFIRSVAKNAIT